MNLRGPDRPFCPEAFINTENKARSLPKFKVAATVNTNSFIGYIRKMLFPHSGVHIVITGFFVRHDERIPYWDILYSG